MIQYTMAAPAAAIFWLCKVWSRALMLSIKVFHQSPWLAMPNWFNFKFWGTQSSVYIIILLTSGLKNSLGVGFRFFHLIELANDIEASCTFGQYWMIVPTDHILLNSFPMWKWKMVKYQINCFSCCCKFCAKGHCPTLFKVRLQILSGLDNLPLPHYQNMHRSHE